MATLQLTEAEDQVRHRVGTAAFLQAKKLLAGSKVVRFSGGVATGQVLGQVHDGGPLSSLAMVQTGPDGSLQALATACTCHASSPCRHGVAVLLAAMGAQSAHRSGEADTDSPAGLTSAPGPAPWERQLTRLTTPSGPSSGAPVRFSPQVALQFELVGDDDRPTGSALSTRIAMRPVSAGARGWVRSGVNWSNLSLQRHHADDCLARHLQLLAELQSLEGRFEDHYSYYRPPQKLLFLETFASRRIWDLLAEAVESGLPLVYADRIGSPVEVHRTPAQVSVQISAVADSLVLDPRLMTGPHRIPVECSIPIGRPSHGIAWWQPGSPADPAGGPSLQLAPTAGHLDAPMVELLLGGSISVPTGDTDRFVSEYYPALRQQVTIVATDDVPLPAPAPPRLRLSVQRRPGHVISTSWDWQYAVGRTERREPLWPADRHGPVGSDGWSAAHPLRDRDAEAQVLEQVMDVVSSQAAVTAALTEATRGTVRLRPASTLDGLAMVALMQHVLPAVRLLPDVDVVISADLDDPDARGDLPDYVEAVEAPTITFSGEAGSHDRDWFDLAVTVTVDGRTVPFTDLFVALAQQQDILILDDGTYFSLDRDELRHLADLIAEARSLQDSPAGIVRLSRFQAGLWAELDELGVVAGQAAEWQQSVRALTDPEVDVDRPPPATLAATLRPYQLAGFQWLAALHELGLGGILADDMGLGKTVQTLALACHLREQDQHRGDPAPLLVLAPTSVVSNWKIEAARFAPELTVATVTETQARRGAPVSSVAAGADVVVTSYTLFRLEYDQYEACDWAGLVLDEAQFVKNHQSRGYQCAKRLPAPFKLAITGTPMENNLMELWSLLSITAPGLYPSPTRFTEHYRTPIEKGGDAELLARLRRRIRPLMLRRTKDQVLTDLPDKQEQVLEIELNPRHRRIYQTYLHRERQKVLGLLGDFDKNRFEIFRSLTLLRQASLDPALVDPAHDTVSATKLDVMMEQVDDIVAEGHRVLIFSQFTRFLTAARHRLEAAGVEVCYLDGTTRNRAKVIAGFKAGTAPAFLISLKAGGVGLNLTEADYCIMLDPWWNPATEAQAVDRTHRIGQTKKVMVYRLVAKDTIEEKVMALKATKAALFDSVMDGEAFASVSLNAIDIEGLLS